MPYFHRFKCLQIELCYTYMVFPDEIRNSKQCRCPPAAAKWTAFILFIVFNLGLQFAFVINHLTMSRYPKRAAKWSGVCPELSIASGFSLQSCMKYFTHKSLPWVHASCNGVAPFLAFTLAFIPTLSIIHFIHSSFPFRAAWCRAVAPKLSNAKGTDRRKDCKVWMSPSRDADKTLSVSSDMIFQSEPKVILCFKNFVCVREPQSRRKSTLCERSWSH